MTRRVPRPTLAVLRLVLATLAIMGQLLIGAAVPAAAATPDAATLLGLPQAICHAHGGPGENAPAHHGIDCALCPLCFALAPIAALPDAAPPLPRPVLALAARPSPPRPDSIAPPVRADEMPPPRGPPALT